MPGGAPPARMPPPGGAAGAHAGAPGHMRTDIGSPRTFAHVLENLKFAFFGPPADYLKGPSARRVVARVLATEAIRVHLEVTRGAPKLHFARGWGAVPKIEIPL